MRQGRRHARPVARNLVDRIWADQPPPPRGPIVPHDLKHAGRPSPDKRHEIAELLAKDAVDAVVLAAPDSIAWLLNVRGSDVAHTPLPLAFAVVHRDATVDLFVEPAKLVPELVEHLGAGVRVAPPDALGARARPSGGAQHQTVQVDATSTAAWVVQRLAAAGATVTRAADPCLVPKASQERRGARGRPERPREGRHRAVSVPGVARSREASSGRLTEIGAADRLDALRAEEPLFRDVSFPTISGAGPNGAIVHYRATPRTDRRIEPGMLYLVDSGAQYLDGTTDVTRTVADRPADAPSSGTGSRVSSAGTSRSRWRASRRGRRAPSWTRSPARRSGTPGSTTTTAPATGWAATSRSTRGRIASPRWATAWRSAPG